jgi:hypothetical protein
LRFKRKTGLRQLALKQAHRHSLVPDSRPGIELPADDCSAFRDVESQRSHLMAHGSLSSQSEQADFRGSMTLVAHPVANPDLLYSTAVSKWLTLSQRVMCLREK